MDQVALESAPEAGLEGHETWQVVEMMRTVENDTANSLNGCFDSSASGSNAL
jgi:hypothetical protein